MQGGQPAKQEPAYSSTSRADPLSLAPTGPIPTLHLVWGLLIQAKDQIEVTSVKGD